MKKCTVFVLILIVVSGYLFLPAYAPAAKSEEICLGLLEHESKARGDRPQIRVRVAFHRGKDGWQAFRNNVKSSEELKEAAPCYPEKASWTVCYEGRKLGEIKSHRPGSLRFYCDVGLHLIDEKENVPTIGEAGREFQFFPVYKAYRPLILCTKPFFVNLGKWTQWKPASADVESVRAYLGQRFPMAANNVKKAKITVNKSFISQRSGSKLMSLNVMDIKLWPIRSDLDPTPHDLWCRIDKGKITFLNTNMKFIDAGDYDGDGSEEVVFMISRYDMDGYALFYDGFSKCAKFTWIYH